MQWLYRTTLAAAAALAGAGPRAAGAQGITRENYLDYLPPRPRIVAQTRATAALHLFGDERDTAYRDADPADGIDDARARQLLAIAELFSPLLRRNNFSVPRDLETVLGRRQTLYVDTWLGNRRVRSDSVELGPAASGATDASSGNRDCATGPVAGAGNATVVGVSTGGVRRGARLMQIVSSGPRRTAADGAPGRP